MTLWSGDTNSPHKDGKATSLALTAYEEALFKDFLRKNPIEKEHARTANDATLTPLRYLFSIFH